MQWVHPDTALAATGLTESVLSHIRQQWYDDILDDLLYQS